MRGDIQLLPIPKRVGLGRWPVVEQCASVNPDLSGEIQAEDMIGAVTCAAETTPPEAVVPPQLALGFLASRGRIAGCAEAEVAVADIGAGSAGWSVTPGESCTEHDDKRQ